MLLSLLIPSSLAAMAAGSGPSLCEAKAALVTLEDGAIAAVEWIERSGKLLHTRTVVTQSRIIESRIELRGDETAARASTTITTAGDPNQPNQPPQDRTFAPGVTYWSGFIASSIEQAVRRARVLGRPVVQLAVASPSSDWKGQVEVVRVDATAWIVTAQGKRFEVLTDSAGCMLAATLPAHGVVIERRREFDPVRYPPWAPYGAPPDSAYAAQAVRIPTPRGHVLAGTLTAPPRRQGRRPAVVLITGLGAHERNNGAPPWMPLRDVSDALTRAGFLVLRVDDRGVGQSTGDRAPSTTFDEADDVQAEVQWLRARADVDPARIALVGYSEGGTVAPIVSARDPRIAAVVLLAGSGVSGPALARYQVEAAVYGDPAIATAARAKEIEKRLAEPLTERERVFLSIDPLAWAAKVRCPALILQGGTDHHVPPRSAESLAFAMRANGNDQVTVRIFDGLSHALLPDPGGLSEQWILLPAFVTSPRLLGTMTTWLVARLRP